MSDSAARERWLEIDAVFQEALELGGEERNDFLDRRCAEDDDLRAAVAGLLASDDTAGSFLEGSAGSLVPDEVAAAFVSDAREGGLDRVGQRVGAFRIVRQVGRGGMAGVYEAERADGQFEQRVAIKFLRRGLDTEDFVRRFLRERRILSSLEHPNIARLIDGGATEEGHPYLALEYVDGVPITEYCTEAGFPLGERLRLFVQVARAVQHAHANLVVHRDIKPSNILVTRDGQVKLLDFGIAKLLEPDDPEATALTRTGLRPLTPQYASPEQVRGGPITTASDVYQLGILLYRLLTGVYPHAGAVTGTTLDEATTSREPPAPSEAARRGDGDGAGPAASLRLARRIRGDLDTIVLKALRRDPSSRYSTAAEMADDVERHLAGRAITARRESALYRAGKFLRRNPWVAPVSAAAVALTAVYVGTLVRHRDQLQRERDVARDVQQAFVSFFTSPDPGDAGLGEGRRDLTIREAIEEGAERVRRDLADRPAARAELFGAMARVLQDLDATEQAHELAAEALELELELYGPASPQVHETLLLVGGLTADPDSARAVLERRRALSATLFGAGSLEMARSLHALAEVDLQQGELEAAVDRLGTAIDIFRGADTVPAREVAAALRELADNLEALDRADEAVEAATEGYDILARELGTQHSETARVGARLAQTLTAAGRFDEARPVYEASLVVLDGELGRTHGTTMSSRNNYAILLRLMGSAEEAASIYRELLQAQRERYGAVHAEVAASLQNLSATVKDLGRYSESEELSLAAHDMFARTRGPDFFQTAYPLLTVAEVRLIQGEHAGAEDAGRRALGILEVALPPGHFATSVARCRIGQALAAQGRPDDARPFLEAGAEALLAGDRREVDAYRDECVAALQELPG